MLRIKELREQREIQQKELAIDLGVTQPTISNWELGRKLPSAKLTQKIADYFGVSVDYVLGRDDEKQPIPVTEDGLDEEQMELVRLFESASPAIRAAALAVLRLAEDRDKFPDEASKAK